MEISLACGNGAKENAALIKEIFMPYFDNEYLKNAQDAAVLDGIDKMAFCTDSFTITPRFFNGGDIGKLSICGTCNDLIMQGAKPKYISAGFIIEEGFNSDELAQIAASMQAECVRNEAIVVTADTKVVPKGSVDGIFINTSAIGKILQPNLSSLNIANGDVLILSGSIGRHGASIFAKREGIEISSNLLSDCASFWPHIKPLFEADLELKALRDATRGGLAAVANEFSQASNLCAQIDEASVLICDEVRGICEFLGLEAYSLANEGTFLLAVSAKDAKRALEILRAQELFKDACIIGEFNTLAPSRVVLKSAYGTQRFLDMPSGELLPRIC